MALDRVDGRIRRDPGATSPATRANGHEPVDDPAQRLSG